MENLNEKQQIEEMAEYIFGNAITHDTRFKEDCRSIAIDLYNANFRKQEWISVEDRLPDNYRAVLVVCQSTSISGGTLRAIGSYGGGFWSLADADGTMHLTKYTHFVVTHWMELPEAPQMKGGAE